MINELQLWLWHELVKWFLQEVFLEAWQKSTLVLISLDECVSCITIGLNRCHDDCAIFILELVWLLNGGCTPINCLLVNSYCIINSERDILNSVTVDFVLVVPLFMSCWIKWSLENEDDGSVFHDVRSVISLAGLETLVSFIFETESRAVVTCCLLSIANVESNVIESIEDANLWSLFGLFVVYHRLK